MLVAIVMVAGGASATTPVPHFINVEEDANNNLPNPVISSLVEDREGFLWFGNARGVTRFDGQEFRQYANRWSAAFGETSLFVRCLLVRHDGSLWVGTDFAGLARYDPLRDRLEPVVLIDNDGRDLSISALAEDDRGALWVGTDGAGLLRLDPDGRLEQMRQADGSGLPDDRITQLLLDRAGTLWVGTWQELVALPRGGSAFVGTAMAMHGRDPLLSVTALFDAPDGQLWIGTRDGRLGYLDAAAGGTWTELPDSSDGAIHAILQPTPNRLWIGRADGLEIREAGSGTLMQQVRHQPGNTRSLGSSEVRALLQDRGGQVWVGSYGGGVQRHNPHNDAFQMLDRHILGSAGPVFSDPNVRAILELSDGRILLGTQARGILVLDAGLAPVDALRDARGQVLFEGTRVTGLAESVDGALWIGGDAGLFRLARGNGELESHSLEGGIVRRMLADRVDGVWVGTEDGLYHFDSHAGAGRQIQDDQQRPLRRSINGLGRDGKGRLWIGGEFGLGWIGPAGGDLHRIVDLHPSQGRNSDVLGLLVDTDDSIWFDTPSGLYRLHPGPDGEGPIDAVSLERGMAGQPFGANLLKDAQGRVWSQDNLFDPALGRLLKLGSADGIDLGTPWFRSYAAIRSGKLLFGGTRGVLVVRPERYRLPAYDVPLVITTLRIDGVETPAAGVRDGLVLGAGQRRIEIEFAALDFSAPEQVRYAYRLAGETGDWVQTDAAHRLVTFANLAPGNYRFELKSYDRHGRPNSQEWVLPIRVQPAWWQLWWVRVLALLALVALAFFLLRQRTRWLRARQHELERSVASRTRELQDVSAALHEKTIALEEASRTDPLTGLRNRRFFSQHIDAHVADLLQQLDASEREGTMGATSGTVFFLLDIDHFKQINDQYGHAAGDAILQQLSQRLRRSFAPEDDLVRWGGEEFLVLVHHCDASRASALAEATLHQIGAEPYALPDQRLLRCSCSLGYASFPLQLRYPRQVQWPEVLELADRALYAAKASGRSGWVGIVADQLEPLAPNPARHLAEEFIAGRLQLRTNLPRARVHQALVAEHE